jgi:hypothetical protein
MNDLTTWCLDLYRFLQYSGLCLIKTGTYTGDGGSRDGDGDAQAITGVGFQVKGLEIYKHPSAEEDIAIYFKLDQTWGDYAVVHTTTATDEHFILADRINSLDADGFTVDDGGDNKNPNANGVTYDYIAWG